MNATTIAIILFIVLCPCISYIIIHKRIHQPWTGGIFLVLDNGAMLPFVKEDKRWHYDCAKIPLDAVATGLHFAGADTMNMPHVECCYLKKEKNERRDLFTKTESNNGGVSVLFSYPLSHRHPKVYCKIESNHNFSLSSGATKYFYRDLEIQGAI